MKKQNLFPLALSVGSLLATFPLAALAITADIFDILVYWVNASILALIGIATIVFMYGVIAYVISKGDEKQLAASKMYMLYGIIGLTVMVAVWGFVNLLIFTIFGSDTDLGAPNYTPFGSGGGGGGGTCLTVMGITVCK